MRDEPFALRTRVFFDTCFVKTGAARPKSAAVQPKTAAAGIADKPALRVRSDRSKPATGWR